jgi:hypothetical protein
MAGVSTRLGIVADYRPEASPAGRSIGADPCQRKAARTSIEIPATVTSSDAVVEASAVQWGYSGYVGDADGYLWNVASGS